MSKKENLTHDHPELLSSAEAAELLKCHPSTIRARVRKGILRPILLKGSTAQFFKKQDVVDLLEKGRKAAPDGYPVHTGTFPVVGIGTCEAGKEVLAEMLRSLPTDLGMAYVIVTDPKSDSEAMMSIVREHTALPAELAVDGSRMEADKVYVVPSRSLVAFEDRILHLSEDPKGLRHDRRPVDRIFRDLGNEFQNGSVAILLATSEDDGVQGAREVRSEGGVVIAYEGLLSRGKATLRDQSMIDLVLPPARMGPALLELHKHLFQQDAISSTKSESDMQKILILLHQRKGVDFTQYKPATIHRRVLRRMGLTHSSGLGSYYKLLRSNTSEVDTLYNDMLINVTTFFRDPLVFRALSRKILPGLIKNRMINDPLRIWVPGCSGGEEVISIAITLLEILGDKALTTPIQIFATDLNEASIERARLGIYKRSSMGSVSPRRLKKYFTEIDGHYQVVKSIRDMCIFARHDLIKDPPFSNLDIISCQNLLIYLELPAQARIMQAFHYALRPEGHLILGRSETPSAGGDLFIETDRRYKVYQAKGSKRRRIPFQLGTAPQPPSIENTFIGRTGARQTDLEVDIDRETDRLLLNKLTPPCVIVNKEHQILRFRGNTNQFLEHGSGKPTLDLLKMIRSDLVFEMRSLLRRAQKDRIPVQRKGIPSASNGIIAEVDLEVVPFGTEQDIYYMVLFRESQVPRIEEQQGPPDGPGDRKDRRIKLLEQEMNDMREQMRLISQEFETATAELQSANEEVVSSNEELQSINEELETSKEELQSINEEFATINDELQLRNDALRESEERLRLSLRTGRMGTWDRDLVQNKITWSDALYDIHGVDPGSFQLDLNSFESLIHPEDRDLLRTRLEETLKKNDPFELEYRALKPDGSSIWLNTNATVLREGGKPVRLLGATLDITERKRNELDLKQRTYTLELLNEVGNKLVAELELNPIVQAVTDAGRLISGAQFGAFFFNVKDEKRGSYMLYTLSGLPKEAFAKFPMPRNTNIFEPTFSGRGPMRIDDVLADVRYGKNAPFKGMPPGHPPVRSYLAIPVISRSGEVLGGLFYGHAQPGVFTQDAEDSLIGLAAQASMAIDNADLYKALQRELEFQKRNQEAIRSSEERLRRVVESMPMAVFTCDREGRIQLFNEAFVELFGPRPVWEGEPWHSGLTIWNSEGQLLGQEEYPLTEALSTGKAFRNKEVILEFGDGRKITALVNPLPIKDAHDKVTGAVNVIVDISDRKQAEEQRRKDAERLRLTIEIARLGIWSYDFKNKRAEMDERCREIYGVEPQEVREDIYKRIIVKEDQPTREKAMLKAMDPQGDGRLDAEYRVINARTMEIHWVRVVGRFYFENGSPVHVIGSVQDITEERQAAEVVRESEERFRMLADNMDQLAWITDHTSRTIWMNRRWKEFTGLDMEQIRENSGRTIYHPDDQDRLVETFKEHFRSGKQWEAEFRLKGKDGEYRWFLTRATPIKDAEGNLERWFGTNTDITEWRSVHQAMRESEERFRLLADNMDQLAWIATADGTSFWFNQRWEEFSGMPVGQILERSRELHHPDHYEQVVRSLTESGEKGEPWEANFPLKRKDGVWRWFLARAIPLRDDNGSITKWFCTCTDITERKEAEESLKETDARKDRFLATLAHELRSPLAPLRNGLELLPMLKGDETEADKVQSMMQRQLKHMVHLIDDLMDLSRISREMIQLRLAPIDLKNAAAQAIESVQPFMQGQGHSFELQVKDDDLIVSGDMTRITQVICNLLNNAAKYTPRSGKIQLFLKRERDQAVIMVKDNGIGIPVDMLSHVFDMFAQVDTAQSSTGGGLGIGLHIVKRLVEMHGGSVRGESQGAGKGSTFTINLPLVEEVLHLDNGASKAAAKIIERRKILVVDDNKDSANSMAALLLALGQQTLTANDGEEAVWAAEKERPQLIFMDIGMPRMNGYEACEKIRSHVWGRSITIVALTGWGQEQDRNRSKEAGFDHHLVKPIDKDNILQILSSVNVAE